MMIFPIHRVYLFSITLNAHLALYYQLSFTFGIFMNKSWSWIWWMTYKVLVMNYCGIYSLACLLPLLVDWFYMYFPGNRGCCGWYSCDNIIVLLQDPRKHQKYVSHVLGLPMSKVVCKTKRIGGGFGGKETRSAFIAAAVSVPAYLLNRPVKIILDRDVDMMITGQRHSFLGKYKVFLSLHK